MRVRRILRSVSKFFSQLCAALVKAVATSIILGIVVVAVMHYMGVPVPSANDLLRGVSKLAHTLS